MSAESSLSRPVLSVVVPLFNEEAIVPELTRRLVESCRAAEIPFEILIVNDGSTDQTCAHLIGASRTIPELRIVNLLRNFGHMPALSAGIALARGEAVVVMDGDLQDPPELIPKFIAEWQRGAEVVCGLRTGREEEALKKKAITLFYWLLDKITETPIPKQVGTFCLMDRRIVDILNRMPERDRYFAGLRAWVGGKQSFIPYDRPDRLHGKSRVGLGGLFRLARTALISFSKIPLRYASLFSLLGGLLLFLIGLIAILVRLFTNLAVPGWATTTTLLGFIGFMQSLVLAVISEYVAVIFDELKGRPLFLVREEIVQGTVVKTTSR